MPIKTHIIRAYLLEKGDTFITAGSEYKVKSNDGTVIKYGKRYDHGYLYFGTLYTMGANSRERVLLIIN